MLAQATEAKPFSKMVSRYLNLIQNVIEVVSRKEDGFTAGLPVNDLEEAFVFVNKKTWMPAEVWERWTTIDKAF